MRIELLHINECPNPDEAARCLVAALAALNHRGTTIHMRLIDSLEDTIGTGFAGSLTITVTHALMVITKNGVPAATGGTVFAFRVRPLPWVGPRFPRSPEC
ncbi:thioredoxin family protein [Arthrobacter sp. KN11-1C]|uniref:thioredoxin family protein n=1 Tax=Arthrobacter sp. KN11-1C TaxID=3445774 RepID=UPI003FA0A21D